MISLRTLLFSCCIRKRTRENQEPDERTPFIPVTDDTPTPPLRVVDHQKLKERLGVVVRSQEGKMVNVNSQYPFNLHNQILGEPSSSRSTRSVSGGTLADSRNASRSPRRHSLQKVHSDASLRHDSEDVFPAPGQDLAVDHVKPILNVRLVNDAGHYGATSSTRGRTGRFGNNEGRLAGAAPVLLVSGNGEDQGEHATVGSEEEGEDSDLLARTPRPQALLSNWQQVSSENGSSGPSNDSHVPPPADDFTIHDAGAVSRSWGD